MGLNFTIYDVRHNLVTKRKALKDGNDWGIPKWRDASAYPDPETTSNFQWKWEFLRRRNDFREDWVKYAAETFENMTKNGGSNPTHAIKILFDIQGFPKSFSSMGDLGFLAEMPGSEKKYGLVWFPNPSNPSPEFLYFFNEPLKDIKFDCGAGGVRDYWGVQYTVFPHEIVLRFDLKVLPVWRLMDQLTTKSLPSKEVQVELNLKDQSPLSQLELWCLCSDESERSYWRKKHKGKSDPRYLIDPHNNHIVHVVINQIQPLGPQVQHIKKNAGRVTKGIHGQNS